MPAGMALSEASRTCMKLLFASGMNLQSSYALIKCTDSKPSTLAGQVDVLQSTGCILLPGWICKATLMRPTVKLARRPLVHVTSMMAPETHKPPPKAHAAKMNTPAETVLSRGARAYCASAFWNAQSCDGGQACQQHLTSIYEKT